MATDRVHQESAARHQSLFREVNERIAALSDAPAPEFEELVCECGRDECTDTVRLTSSEYEEIRQHPTWFAVTPGHLDPDVERLVENGTDRYEVVQKVERAGEVAKAMDPRGSTRER